MEENQINNQEEETREEKPQEGNSDTSIESGEEDKDAKIKELEEAKKGMEEQLIAIRKRAQEAEAAKGETPTQDTPSNDEDPVAAKVRAELEKDRKRQAETNRVEALNKFWEKHKEFHPENDSTGIKSEALKNSLKRLNTSNSYTTEAILKDYEDAYRLMRKDDNKPSENTDNLNKLASTDTVPGNPGKATTSKLTAEQEALRKQKGWSEEKYFEMKAKYPKIIL